MRIVFCWEWENSMDVIVRLDEGIGEVLRKFARDGHEVYVITWGNGAGENQGLHFRLIPKSLGYETWVGMVDSLNPELVLGWGSIDHKIYPLIRERLPHTPMYLFLAGGGVDHENTKVFDGYFVETNFHVGSLNARGKPAWKALGVMTDVLYPVRQEKVWDIIFPASFTCNKRYDLFADIVEFGNVRGVAVGPVNEQGNWLECKNVSIPTFGYVSRSVLRDFYNASRVTVLTAGIWGGCQRALLESLACGIPVVSTDDNNQLDWLNSAGAPVYWSPPKVDRLIETVKLALKENENSSRASEYRKFVVDNFSADHYYGVVKEVVMKTQEVSK